SPALLAQTSQFIASRIGLNLPQERWEDMANGLASAACEQGLGDAEAYVQWLLSTPLTRREIEILASHLTVGETYFFREKKSFTILEEQILPELIRLHRGDGMRLRIWSAGCCTGEEPYSVAMLLDRLMPDLADWNVTILATDINPQFLKIASAGVYGEWSFRASPPEIIERYFSPLPDGRMQIARRIRQMVTFSFLNLAEDVYPSTLNNTNAMDVVLCRNVLMYFTTEHASRVVENLHGALTENGWLLVAPSETSQVLFRQFTAVDFPDAIFYRKHTRAGPRFSREESEPVWFPGPNKIEEEPSSTEESKGEEDPTLPISIQTESPIFLALALANKGELVEALSWCDRAVSLDALNPAHRFLRAMVMQELGRLDEAIKSLEQALYLDQSFIMAHVAMGNIAKRLGRRALSRRHFRSALGLLDSREPNAPLPESEGLTADRLREIIRSTLNGGSSKP
ncbi:MAG: CheR family methyltransferase, partial [Candidatus Sulfotelmatobacter sp.]